MKRILFLFALAFAYVPQSSFLHALARGTNPVSEESQSPQEEKGVIASFFTREINQIASSFGDRIVDKQTKKLLGEVIKHFAEIIKQIDKNEIRKVLAALKAIQWDRDVHPAITHFVETGKQVNTTAKQTSKAIWWLRFGLPLIILTALVYLCDKLFTFLKWLKKYPAKGENKKQNSVISPAPQPILIEV